MSGKKRKGVAGRRQRAFAQGSLAGCPPATGEVSPINWPRLGKLALVGIGTFAAIWIGGVVLALSWAPTSSPSRLVAYLGSMFAVTGGVLAVVIWAAKNKV